MCKTFTSEEENTINSHALKNNSFTGDQADFTTNVFSLHLEWRS